MGRFFGYEGKLERLSNGGYNAREIAYELGMSESEVLDRLNDPYRESYEDDDED